MRLTLKEVIMNTSHRKEFKHINDLLKQEQKELIEYKTIEEELGIDLITFHKALKNGIYVRMGSFINDYDGHSLSFQCDCFVVGYGYDTYVYYFKDYGKTWALTKEELK